MADLSRVGLLFSAANDAKNRRAVERWTVSQKSKYPSGFVDSLRRQRLRLQARTRATAMQRDLALDRLRVLEEMFGVCPRENVPPASEPTCADPFSHGEIVVGVCQRCGRHIVRRHPGGGMTGPNGDPYLVLRRRNGESIAQFAARAKSTVLRTKERGA